MNGIQKYKHKFVSYRISVLKYWKRRCGSKNNNEISTIIYQLVLPNDFWFSLTNVLTNYLHFWHESVNFCYYV